MFPYSWCYTNVESSKLIAFFESKTGRIIRLDCFVVESLKMIEKFILNGNLSETSLPRILVYENVTNNNNVKNDLIELIRQSECNMAIGELKQLIFSLIGKFIESFEVSSNKRAVGDKFQYLFQLQLAYTYLLKLEYIRFGGRDFLYILRICRIKFVVDLKMN